MNSRLATIRLTKPLEEAVRGGHPWVFADALAVPAGLGDGAVVDLLDRRGDFLARGTIEPGSPLAFRSWTLDREEAVDAALVERRLESALQMRRAILREDVSGFRVCHGEADFVPGLQCDAYGMDPSGRVDVASLRTDGALGAVWEETFVAAVNRVVKPRAIVVRNPKVAEGEARVVTGELPAAAARGELEIGEHGRQFFVDVLRGQKTGFFLDQRENRDRVGALARGRRVLNLFAYTGGFSVAAALGGAARVTSVDLAAPAVAAARRNFELNGITTSSRAGDSDGHEFIASDAFDVLAELAARPPPKSVAAAAYDLIVLDPPSFAPSKKLVPRATKAYEKLNELALRSLPAGGWLATASCSSHVREADFLAILATAARRAGRDVSLAGVHGAAPDHPIRLGFPEGRYLKFLLLRVL